MQFDYAYHGDSTVSNGVDRTAMSFAPDTLRQPAFFRGKLRQPLAFRQAISALHDVVVSDLRWKPKDRTEYLHWRAAQDAEDLATIAVRRKEVVQRIKEINAEFKTLFDKSYQRQKPYLDAKRAYFQFLLERDYQAWIVLDPVITVHPDQVFFECFSKDESSYGRLAANYNVFEDVGEFACGTTNIDYSEALYDEFQKIRSYKTTTFAIDPSGFEVATSSDDPAHKEVKIDLPDSWVRGFLQVSSAMALPALTFRLHPMDIHNICLVLRRHKELIGPRALRYCLEPGKPVRVLFEPWGYEVTCPRSVYEGDVADEVRVWGRRRLHTLERLVPVARSFTVHLLGKGMPSFYLADLGDMSYTLGLSGWTAQRLVGSRQLRPPRPPRRGGRRHQTPRLRGAVRSLVGDPRRPGAPARPRPGGRPRRPGRLHPGRAGGLRPGDRLLPAPRAQSRTAADGPPPVPERARGARHAVPRPGSRGLGRNRRR